MIVVLLISLAGFAQVDLPKGPGRDLTYAKCRSCHGLEYVLDSAGISSAMWETTVIEMEKLGMEVTREEQEAILEYLTIYLGPNPPPEEKAGGENRADKSVNAADLYETHCSACHGVEGKGKSGEYPPLAGNPWLVKTAEYGALVTVHGLQGEIEVKGEKYDGIMPPFAHLKDREIAAILNYTLAGAGNDLLSESEPKPVTSETVKRSRAKRLTPKQVWRYRSQLKVSEKPDH